VGGGILHFDLEVKLARTLLKISVDQTGCTLEIGVAG
jgi:hypothetical protein